MKAQNLIPKSKGDLATAQMLFSYSYEEIRSIIPQLLEWIQDMNWPVAQPVSEYLASISENISEELVEVLQGDDNIWKYWCIHVFGLWSEKRIDPLMEKEIRRIVNKPTQGEIQEKVYEVAKELLENIKKET